MSDRPQGLQCSDPGPLTEFGAVPCEACPECLAYRHLVDMRALRDLVEERDEKDEELATLRRRLGDLEQLIRFERFATEFAVRHTFSKYEGVSDPADGIVRNAVDACRFRAADVIRLLYPPEPDGGSERG